METNETKTVKITLTASAADEKELAAVLHEVAKDISQGCVAANVGGLVASWQFNIEKQPARSNPAPAITPKRACPECGGDGSVPAWGPGFVSCTSCDGTGLV